MGPSQGRHSNVAAIRLLAEATGRGIEEVGTTTTRPPFVAEKFAHPPGAASTPSGTRRCTTGTWSSAPG